MDFRQQPSLNQRQKQTYIPNLLQGVQLLQLNRIELSTYLSDQVIDNPFIEVPDQEIHLVQSALKESVDTIEQTASNRQSLYEFLKEQIELFYRKTYLRELVFWWVNQLDHRGYVTKTVDDALSETGASSVELLDSLTLLHQLDPPGIGARSLRESLMLQTERLDFAPPLAYMILEENFEALSNQEWTHLAQVYDISEGEARDIYAFIQKLTPSPGEAFQPAYTPFILPELNVYVVQGELVIEETKFRTPLLTFNTEYFNGLQKSADTAVQSYMKEKKQEYDTLQKSLKRRKETILQVGTAIVMHQRGFFEDGHKALVPLQLNDLARELNLNESTISRAVRETYIQTPSGSYELKSFLSRRSSHADVSKDQISQAIDQLISAEDKTKPLSDQAISDKLKSQGMTLSRRGVTKYRKQLGHPSSTKRKQK